MNLFEEWVLGCVQLPTRLPVVICYDSEIRSVVLTRAHATAGFHKSCWRLCSCLAVRGARSRLIRCGESECYVLLQELGWAEGHNLRIDTGVCFLKQKQ